MEINSKFECLLATNDLLDQLVAIHNEIFNRSLRNFFKAIPFDNLRLRLSHLLSTLDDIQIAYKQLPSGPLPIDWELVDPVYSDYCRAVTAAHIKLDVICQHLEAKANGIPYTKPHYEHDLANYEGTVSGYKLIGAMLNSIVRA
jgi:hypothetical protein